MTITETKLVEKLHEWYRAAADPSQGNKWRSRAAKCLRFYDGTGQWSESVKMLLTEQNRPALTINRILPTVNVVWGQLIQNRTELKLVPKRRGTKEIAQLGSALIKDVMDSCQGYDASSDSFRDGVITGKGWTVADHVYERDPVTGELIVEAPNPLFMYEDPRCTDYDINAGEYVFRERFWTKNKLKAYFPSKYKEALAASQTDWLEPVENESGDTMVSLVVALNAMNGYQNVIGSDGELSGVVLRECYWREYKAVTMAVIRQQDGTTSTAEIRTPADEALLDGFAQVRTDISVTKSKTVVIRLHLAVMVGNLLLRREENPLNGMTQFPYVRFSPYWLHGEPFGVVDNLIGPQEELNKSRSNLLHDANISGNPTWRATRATPEGRRQLETYGSTPGGLLEEDDFGGKIERVEAGGLSSAHANLSEINASDIQQISGANPNLMGTPTETNESGRARLIQQEAGLKVLAPVLGNYYRSQSMLGDRVWEYIRRNNVYDAREILAVIDRDIIEALGGPEGVVEQINRWDTGYYGVKAVPAKTTAAWTDVQIDEVMKVIEIFGQTGLQLPPVAAQEMAIQVLELSSFPGSSKIADQLRQAPPVPIPQEQPGQPQNPKQGTRQGAALAASGGG